MRVKRINYIFFALLFLFAPAAIRAEAPKENKEAPKPGAPGAAEAAPAPLEPGTDIVCEADIFYNWKPQGFAQKKILPGDATAPAPEDVVAPEPPDSIREFFTTAGEQGLVEEEVTNRLNTK